MSIKIEFQGNPGYKLVEALRPQTLESYLQLGVILWAAHHGKSLPLDRDSEDGYGMVADLQEFESWLFGEGYSFKVIDGGLPDEPA